MSQKKVIKGISKNIDDLMSVHADNLSSKIQKIVNDFEKKTKTTVLIDFKINEPIKIRLIVNLDDFGL